MSKVKYFAQKSPRKITRKLYVQEARNVKEKWRLVESLDKELILPNYAAIWQYSNTFSIF